MKQIAAPAAVVLALMAGVFTAPFDPPYGTKILIALASASIAVLAIVTMPTTPGEWSRRDSVTSTPRWQQHKLVQLVVGLVVAAVAHLVFKVPSAWCAVMAIFSAVLSGVALPGEGAQDADQA